VTVRIRIATSNDIDLIVSRRLEFLASVRGPDYRMPAGFEAATRSFVAAERDGGRLHTWIAEDDGVFLGIVSIMLWARPPQPEDLRTAEAYIINMYVPPNNQRRGIGRLLLDECIDSADQLGIRKFLLHSTEEGRRLYQARGFEAKSNWMELPVKP